MQKFTTDELVIKSATKDYVTIGGYASVFGVVDSHSDIVLRGAFSSCNSLHNIKFLWQHDATKPIGVITSMVEDEYGLYIEANINSFIQQGQEAIALLKQGAVSSFSIGFTVSKSRNNADGYREITDANLWEVSIVTFPANSYAQIQHIKSSDFQTFERLNRSLDKILSTISTL